MGNRFLHFKSEFQIVAFDEFTCIVPVKTCFKKSEHLWIQSSNSRAKIMVKSYLIESDSIIKKISNSFLFLRFLQSVFNLSLILSIYHKNGLT